MIRYLLAICFLGLVICTSCVPQKDIIYLQDKGNTNDTIPSVVEQQKPYRVQINDILNIRIKVLDQDDATIFNPTGEGELQASPQERAYFDGFTVDLHGNILMPKLGEINVLGFTTDEINDLCRLSIATNNHFFVSLLYFDHPYLRQKR